MDSSTSYFVLAFAFFFLTSSASLTASGGKHNVLDYGAKPDGRTDSSKAFLATWEQACGSTKPTTIYVPPSKFLLPEVAFRGPCKNNATSIRIDGTLVAPSDYRVLGEQWIFFENVNGVSIFGGILDGRGIGLWTCKNSSRNCPTGATSLGFTKSKNIVIMGLTSLNSQMFHIVINGCQKVRMQGLRISASYRSPNTDGIHVQLSDGVTILNTKIKTGDDCVSIGAGTTDLRIENVVCGPGHGISIGSLGKDLEEPGVQNVTVKNVTLTDSQNGLRIKSWGRPSNGFAKDILFQHVVMTNVQNPIFIDQNYCPDNKDCPGQASGTKISNVTYKDIHGTSATQVAVKFDCSKKHPCTGIRLEDVKLTYRNRLAYASCRNVDGITASGSVQPQSCL